MILKSLYFLRVYIFVLLKNKNIDSYCFYIIRPFPCPIPIRGRGRRPFFPFPLWGWDRDVFLLKFPSIKMAVASINIEIIKKISHTHSPMGMGEGYTFKYDFG